MKCWICGMDNPEGASVCLNCNNELARPECTSEEGKVLRSIFDMYGPEKVFSGSSCLVNALGDFLPDNGTLRNQIRMVMDTGVGKLYQKQLKETGHPDKAFRDRVLKLITEDAGFSEKIARNLMGYFDEMIGWKEAGKARKAAKAEKPAQEPPKAEKAAEPVKDDQQVAEQTAQKKARTKPIVIALIVLLGIGAVLGILEVVLPGPNKISSLINELINGKKTEGTLLSDTGKADYVFGFDIGAEEVKKAADSVFRNAAGWTDKTAPQTLDSFPLMPAGIYQIYEQISKTTSTLKTNQNAYNWEFAISERLPDWKPDGDGGMYFYSETNDGAWSSGDMNRISNNKYSFSLPGNMTSINLKAVGQYTWKSVYDVSAGLSDNLWVMYSVENGTVKSINDFKLSIATDEYRIEWIPYENDGKRINKRSNFRIEVWTIDPNNNYASKDMLCSLTYNNDTGKLIPGK